MLDRLSANQELEYRLVGELARRVGYSWVMYAVFVALFAAESHFGRDHPRAAWIFLILILVTGILRPNSSLS